MASGTGSRRYVLCRSRRPVCGGPYHPECSQRCEIRLPHWRAACCRREGCRDFLSLPYPRLLSPSASDAPETRPNPLAIVAKPDIPLFIAFHEEKHYEARALIHVLIIPHRET